MSQHYNVITTYRREGRLYDGCLCECGVFFTARHDALQRGDTLSCGCYRRKRLSDMRTGKPPIIKRHGEAKKPVTPEYNAWNHMKTRCTNIRTKDWPDYGGRGIKICPQWLVFKNFLTDMGRKPVGKYSLDRINVNGNYEPLNCRWATDKEQANNKRKYKTLFHTN